MELGSVSKTPQRLWEALAQVFLVTGSPSLAPS
jgi:hypothetical protein